MNLLDENFPDDQRAVLRGWRIPFRQIGVNLGHLGIKDENVIPLLHRQRHVTFFTQDEDFFLRRLGHAAYRLVWLDVRADDLAHYVRRFLRHPRFGTAAERMAIVARVHPEGIHFWHGHRAMLQRIYWPMAQ